jgi:hypothetical protein
MNLFDSQSINCLSHKVMRPFTLKATLRCYLQMIPALKVTAVNTKNLVNLLDTSLVCSTSRHFTRRLIGQLNTSVNTSVHSSRRSIHQIGPFSTSVHLTRRSIQHVGQPNPTLRSTQYHISQLDSSSIRSPARLDIREHHRASYSATEPRITPADRLLVPSSA